MYRQTGITALLSCLVLSACGSEETDRGSDAGDASTPSPTPTVASPTPTPAPTDTWSTFARGFFESYCTECHGDGDRDYTTLTHIERDAPTIRCGVSPDELDGCEPWPPPGQFPVGSGPEPDDSERRRLVSWLDAGMPE